MRDSMNVLAIVCQIIIAAGIVNVWLFRFKKPTPWRGGEAGSMPEEFRAYGLPDWMMKLVGGLKLLLAGLLVVGIWYEALAAPAAAATGLLMIGAIAMHVRVKDPWRRSIPAAAMLLMSVIVFVSYS